MASQGEDLQKVLVLGENDSLDHVHWSPDGQRLGYVREQRTPEKYLTSIETCDLKGTNRTVVVAGTDPWLRDFCWLPGGRIVYSRQEYPGSNEDNLWQIGFDAQAGTHTGKPKRITQWAGSFLWFVSASADGKRLTLQKGTFQGQVYQFISSPNKALRFYLNAGSAEFNATGGADSILFCTRTLRDVLRAKGYEVHFQEFAGGHDTLNWRGTLRWPDCADGW
jgi:hypothetical protein